MSEATAPDSTTYGNQAGPTPPYSDLFMPQNTASANSAVTAKSPDPEPEWVYIVYRETWSMLPASQIQQFQTAICHHVPGVSSPPDFYFIGAEMVDAHLLITWVGTDQVKAREKLLEVVGSVELVPKGTKATTWGRDLVYFYTEESKAPSELCGKAWIEEHVLDRT